MNNRTEQNTELIDPILSFFNPHIAINTHRAISLSISNIRKCYKYRLVLPAYSQASQARDAGSTPVGRSKKLFYAAPCGAAFFIEAYPKCVNHKAEIFIGFSIN